MGLKKAEKGWGVFIYRAKYVINLALEVNKRSALFLSTFIIFVEFVTQSTDANA